MIRSLGRYCPGMQIYVLCMDDQTRFILERLKIPSVHCVCLSEVENAELLRAKADRTMAEYCWTLSSCFTWYVMQNNPKIDFLTYVDADLLFYSDVQPLFDEIGEASIAIIEHRFSDWLKDREVNGRFCVEWVGFRRDAQGLSCLGRWREQCLEWCYYRLEDGKMGDQKYLDDWPARYPDCHILQHPGAGVAPWNYDQYAFTFNSEMQIAVQATPLIFYHFHQFQLLKNGKFDRLSNFYTMHCPEPNPVYEAYEIALEQSLSEVRAIDIGFSAGMRSVWPKRSRQLASRCFPEWLKRIFRVAFV